MPECLKVFILGSPRSGTSITYYAMRQVLKLQGRGESHVFPLFLRLVHQFYTYNQDFKKIPGVLAGDLDTSKFRITVQKHLREFYAEKYPGGSFVDKTPGTESIRACGMILATFPDAKVMVLQRNGIEVVSSYQRKFGSPFLSACQAWRQVVSATAELRKNRPEILVTDQYDLTNAPAVSAERMARYLGRPELAEALAGFFTEKRVEQGSTHDWSRRLTLADVDWTTEEKDIFREICSEPMNTLGYAM